MSEVRTVWVPYVQKADGEVGDKLCKFRNKFVPFGKRRYTPLSDADTTKAEAVIKNLVASGFRIVATVPVTGSEYDHETKVVMVYTTGYEVWLQK